MLSITEIKNSSIKNVHFIDKPLFFAFYLCVCHFSRIKIFLV